MEKKSLLRWDTKHIIKHSFISIIFTWILIWFLFFLFNTFSGMIIKEKEITESMASKIGMYFYIQDEKDPSSDEIYKRIINIKDQLAENWIKAEFSSKNDAFGFLESKIPEITENFEKFWIENTLPSTLYVMFKNEKEYNIMKDIIVANKDIILNVNYKQSTWHTTGKPGVVIPKITDIPFILIYFSNESISALFGYVK